MYRKQAFNQEIFFLRKVRDSNPRYDVMRTPHFECGSFDHSDNFPIIISKQHCRLIVKCGCKSNTFSAYHKIFFVFFICDF